MIGVFGYCLIVLCVLTPFVGCVVGGAAGYRAANGPLPVGPASLFISDNPPSMMPEFWVVQYPKDDTKDPNPRLIDLSDPDRNSPDWHYGPPAIQSRLTTGPWDTTAYRSDEQARTQIPAGNLKINAGGVSFATLEDGSIRAELIVYPADRPDGWDRWYYIYDIADNAAEPVSAYREANRSDWTGESVLVYSIGGLLIGTVIGVVLVALGLAKGLVRIG